MAKLPGVQLDPQSGQLPSMAALRPTDLNLGEAADAVSKIGEAMAARDDKAVQPKLQELAASYGRDFATASETDDGTKPGFAQSRMAAYDAHAAELIKASGLQGGQAEALRRGIEKQRIYWGNKAASTEAELAGHFAADQERALKNGRAQGGLGDYRQIIAPRLQALDDSYDGSDPNYLAKVDALHEEAASQVLANTPEADRPTVKVLLDNARLDLRTQASENATKTAKQQVVRQVKTTRDKVTSALVTNPNGIRAALGQLPGLLADLPADVRPNVQAQTQAQYVAARIQGLKLKGQPALAIAELEKGTWDGELNGEQKGALLEDLRGEAGRRARDALEAMHYGGDVNDATADADAEASGDIGLQQELRYRRAVGWGEASAGGAGSDGFAGGVGGGFSDIGAFVMSQFEDPTGKGVLIPNDGGRGPTKYGINSQANPDVNLATLTRDQALGIFKKRYWVPSGADRLPPDLALIQFDTAVNMGVDTARDMLAQSGGDPGKYLAIRAQRYQELGKQPQHKGDLAGWMNRLDKLGAQAARMTAFVNTKEGLTGDPIKFAAKTPAFASQVAALVGEPGEAGWSQALQQRLSLGRQLSDRYHVPARMLTDGEAAFYKDKIGADPTYALNLTQAALKAVGPAGARQMLAEVGQQGEGGVHLHLADLYAMGSQEFARRGERGLALQAKGVKLDKADADDLKKAMAERAGVLGPSPELRLAVEATARSAMIADQEDGGLKGDGAARYVEAAVGGRRIGGQLFGGVAKVNGRETVVPPWLAADRLDDVLEHLGEGFEANAKAKRSTWPVWANGKPLTAREVGQQSLQLTPGGRYRLVHPDGRAFQTNAGGPMELNLDAARSGLRARFGRQAVLSP